MANVSVSTPKGGSWKFRANRQGFIELLRAHEFSSPTKTLDAMGNHWMFAIASISSGAVTYQTHASEIEISGTYGVFIPCFSLLYSTIRSPDQQLTCIIGNDRLPQKFSERAIIFDATPGEPVPQTTSELAERLERAHNVRTIEYNDKPSAISKRIRHAINKSFLKNVTLKEIAQDLNIDQTTLGRRFRHDFATTPVAYRNLMRVTTASFELLRGRMIVDVFQDVGFDDLSRFNKNFRAVTGTTPKIFQPPKQDANKSRKTPRKKS